MRQHCGGVAGKVQVEQLLGHEHVEREHTREAIEQGAGDVHLIALELLDLIGHRIAERRSQS